MDEDDYNKKLQLGKEKFAAFRKKKSKKKRKRAGGEDGGLTSDTSASDMSSMGEESDLEGTDSDTDKGGVSLMAHHQAQNRLLQQKERITELEETLYGKQAALDSLLDENEELRASLQHKEQGQVNGNSLSIKDLEVSSSDEQEANTLEELKSKLSELLSVVSERDQVIEQLSGRLATSDESRDQLQTDYTSQAEQMAQQVLLLQEQLKQANVSLHAPVGSGERSFPVQALLEAKNELLAVQQVSHQKDSQLLALQNALKQRDATLQHLTGKFNESTRDYAGAHEELRTIKDKLERSTERCLRLERETDKLRVNYTEQAKQLAELRKTHSDGSSLAESSKLFQELQAENRELRRKDMESGSVITQLMSSVESFKSTRKSPSPDISFTEDEMVAQEEHLKQMQSLRSELDEVYGEQISQIKDTIKEQYESRLHKLSQEVDSLSAENSHLSSQVTRWQQQYVSLGEQNVSSTDLISQISQLTSENAEYRQQVEELREKAKESGRQETQKVEMFSTSEKTKLVNEMEDAKTKLVELAELCEQGQVFREKAEELSQQVKQMQSEQDVYLNKIDAQKKHIEQLNSVLTETSSQRDSYKVQLDSSEKALLEAKTSHGEELGLIRSQFEQKAQLDLAELQGELAAARAEIEIAHEHKRHSSSDIPHKDLELLMGLHKEQLETLKSEYESKLKAASAEQAATHSTGSGDQVEPAQEHLVIQQQYENTVSELVSRLHQVEAQNAALLAQQDTTGVGEGAVDILDLTAKLSQTAMERDSALKSVQDLYSDRVEQKQELDQLKRDKEGLERRLLLVMKEYDQVVNDKAKINEELSLSVSRSQEIQDQLNESSFEMELLNTQLQDLSSQKTTVQSELSDLKQEKEAIEGQLGALLTERETLQTQMVQYQLAKEEDTQSDLADQLKAQFNQVKLQYSMELEKARTQHLTTLAKLEEVMKERQVLQARHAQTRLAYDSLRAQYAAQEKTEQATVSSTDTSAVQDDQEVVSKVELQQLKMGYSVVYAEMTRLREALVQLQDVNTERENVKAQFETQVAELKQELEERERIVSGVQETHTVVSTAPTVVDGPQLDLESVETQTDVFQSSSISTETEACVLSSQSAASQTVSQDDLGVPPGDLLDSGSSLALPHQTHGENNMEGLVEENSELQEQVRSLQEEIQLVNDYDRSSTPVRDPSIGAGVGDEVSHLQRHLTEARSTIDQLLAQQQCSREDHEQELTQLVKKLDAYVEDNQAVQAEFDKDRARFQQEMQLMSQRLEQAISEKHSLSEVHHKHMEQLQHDKQASEEDMAHQLEQVDAEHGIEVATYKKQIADLKSDVESLRAEKSQLEAEFESEMHDMSEEQSTRVRSIRESYEQEIDSLRTALNEINTTISDQQEELISRYENEIESLKFECGDVDLRLRQVMDEKDTLQDQQEEILKSFSEEQAEGLHGLLKQIEDLTAGKRASAERVLALNAQLEFVQMTVDQLEEDNKRLRDNINELNMQKTEVIGNLQVEMDQHQQALLQLEADNQRLQDQLSAEGQSAGSLDAVDSNVAVPLVESPVIALKTSAAATEGGSETVGSESETVGHVCETVEGQSEPVGDQIEPFGDATVPSEGVNELVCGDSESTGGETTALEASVMEEHSAEAGEQTLCVEDFRQQILQLETELQSLHDEKAKVEHVYQEEISRQREEDDQLLSIQAENEQLHKSCSEQSAALNNLALELDLYKSKIADSDHAVKSIEIEKDESIANLESSLIDLRGENSRLLKERDDANEEVSALIAGFRSLQPEGQELDSCHDVLVSNVQDKLTVVQSMLDEAEAKVKMMEQEKEAASVESSKVMEVMQDVHDKEVESLQSQITLLQQGDAQSQLSSLQMMEQEKEAASVESSKVMEVMQDVHDKEVESLQSQITLLQQGDAQSQLSSLQEERDGLQSQLSSLQEERDSLQSQLSSLQEEQNSLQSQLDSSQEERDSLQSQLTSSQEERDSLQSQLSLLQNKCDNLQSQTSSSQQEHDSIQSQLASSQAESDSLHSQLASSQEESDRLHSQLASSQEESDSLQSQLSLLKKDCESLQSQLASSQEERDSLQSQLASSQEDLDSLRSQLSSSQEDCDTTLSQLASSQEYCDSLQSKLTVSQQHHDDLEKEMTHKVQVLENEKTSMSVHLKQALEDMEVKVKEELSALHEQLRDLEEEKKLTINDLQVQLQAKKDQVSHLMEEQAFTVIQSQSLEAEIASLLPLSDELREKEELLLEANSEIEALQHKFTQLGDDLKSSLAENIDRTSMLELSRAETGTLQQDIENLQADVESLESEKRTLLEGESALKDELAKKTRQVEEMVIVIENMESGLTDLQSSSSHAETTAYGLHEAVESLEREVGKFQMNCDQLEMENEELQSKVVELKRQIEEGHSAGEAQRARYEELEEEKLSMVKRFEELKQRVDQEELLLGDARSKCQELDPSGLSVDPGDDGNKQDQETVQLHHQIKALQDQITSLSAENEWMKTDKQQLEEALSGFIENNEIQTATVDSGVAMDKMPVEEELVELTSQPQVHSSVNQGWEDAVFEDEVAEADSREVENLRSQLLMSSEENDALRSKFEAETSRLRSQLNDSSEEGLSAEERWNKSDDTALKQVLLEQEEVIKRLKDQVQLLTNQLTATSTHDVSHSEGTQEVSLRDIYVNSIKQLNQDLMETRSHNSQLEEELLKLQSQMDEPEGHKAPLSGDAMPSNDKVIEEIQQQHGVEIKVLEYNLTERHNQEVRGLKAGLMDELEREYKQKEEELKLACEQQVKSHQAESERQFVEELRKVRQELDRKHTDSLERLRVKYETDLLHQEYDGDTETKHQDMILKLHTDKAELCEARDHLLQQLDASHRREEELQEQMLAMTSNASLTSPANDASLEFDGEEWRVRYDQLMGVKKALEEQLEAQQRSDEGLQLPSNHEELQVRLEELQTENENLKTRLQDHSLGIQEHLQEELMDMYAKYRNIVQENEVLTNRLKDSGLHTDSAKSDPVSRESSRDGFLDPRLQVQASLQGNLDRATPSSNQGADNVVSAESASKEYSVAAADSDSGSSVVPAEKYQALSAEHQCLQDEFNKYRDKARKEHTKMKAKAVAASREVEKLKGQLAALSKPDTANENLMLELIDLQSQNAVLISENTVYSESCKQAEELEIRCDELERANKDLIVENARSVESQTLLGELQSRCENLNQRNEELESENRLFKESHKLLTELESQCDELSKKNAELTAVSDNARAELSDCQKAGEDLSKLQSTYQELLADHRQSLQGLEEVQSNYEAESASNVQLTHEVEKLKESLNQQRKSNKASLHQLGEENKQLKNAKADRNFRVRELEGEKEEMAKKNEALITASQAVVTELEARVSSLEREKSDLHVQFDSQTVSLDEISGRLKSVEMENANLLEELTNMHLVCAEQNDCKERSHADVATSPIPMHEVVERQMNGDGVMNNLMQSTPKSKRRGSRGEDSRAIVTSLGNSVEPQVSPVKNVPVSVSPIKPVVDGASTGGFPIKVASDMDKHWQSLRNRYSQTLATNHSMRVRLDDVMDHVHRLEEQLLSMGISRQDILSISGAPHSLVPYSDEDDLGEDIPESIIPFLSLFVEEGDSITCQDDHTNIAEDETLQKGVTSAMKSDRTLTLPEAVTPLLEVNDSVKAKSASPPQKQSDRSKSLSANSSKKKAPAKASPKVKDSKPQQSAATQKPTPGKSSKKPTTSTATAAKTAPASKSKTQKSSDLSQSQSGSMSDLLRLAKENEKLMEQNRQLTASLEKGLCETTEGLGKISKKKVETPSRNTKSKPYGSVVKTKQDDEVKKLRQERIGLEKEIESLRRECEKKTKENTELLSAIRGNMQVPSGADLVEARIQIELLLAEKSKLCSEYERDKSKLEMDLHDLQEKNEVLEMSVNRDSEASSPDSLVSSSQNKASDADVGMQVAVLTQKLEATRRENKDLEVQLQMLLEEKKQVCAQLQMDGSVARQQLQQVLSREEELRKEHKELESKHQLLVGEHQEVCSELESLHSQALSRQNEHLALLEVAVEAPIVPVSDTASSTGRDLTDNASVCSELSAVINTDPSLMAVGVISNPSSTSHADLTMLNEILMQEKIEVCRKLEKCEDEAVKLRQNLRQAGSVYEHLQREHEKMLNQRGVYAVQAELLMDEKKDVCDRVEEKDAQIQQLQSSLIGMENDVKAQKTVIDSLQSQHNSLLVENEHLKTRLSEESCVEARSQIADLKCRNEVWKTKVNELLVEREKIEQDLQILREEHDGLKVQFAKVLSEKENLFSERLQKLDAERQNVADELDEMKFNYDEQILVNAQEEKNRCDNAHQELVSEVAKLRSILSERDEKMEEISREKEALEEEMKRLKKELEYSENYAKDLQESLEECWSGKAALKEEVAKITKELEKQKKMQGAPGSSSGDSRKTAKKGGQKRPHTVTGVHETDNEDQLQSLTAQNLNLTQQLEAISATLKNKESEVAKVVIEREDILETLEKLYIEKKNKDDSLNALEAEKAKVETELTTLRHSLADTDKEMADLKTKLEQAQNAFDAFKSVSESRMDDIKSQMDKQSQCLSVLASEKNAAQTEVKELKVNSQQLLDKVDALESELNVKENELATVVRQRSDVQGLHDLLTAEKLEAEVEHEKTKCHLTDEVASIQEKLDRAKVQLHAKDSELSQLNEELAEVQKSNCSLIESLNQKDTSIRELHGHVSSLEQDAVSLETAVQTLKEEASDKTKELTDMRISSQQEHEFVEGEKNQLQGQLCLISQERENLLTKCIDLERALAVLESKSTQAQEELITFGDRCAEKEDRVQQLEEMVTARKLEWEAQSAEKTLLQTEFEVIQSKVSHLEEQCRQVNDTLKLVAQERDDAQGELQSTSLELETLEKHSAQLDKDKIAATTWAEDQMVIKEDLEKQLGDTKQSIEKLSNDYNCQSFALEEMNSTLERAELLASKAVEDHDAAISGWRDKCKGLQTELDVFRTNENTAKSGVEMLTANLFEKTSALSELEAKCQALNEDLDALKSEHSDLEERFGVISTEKHTADDEITQYLQQASVLEVTISTLRADLESSSRLNSDLEDAKSILEGKCQSAELEKKRVLEELLSLQEAASINKDLCTDLEKDNKRLQELLLVKTEEGEKLREEMISQLNTAAAENKQTLSDLKESYTAGSDMKLEIGCLQEQVEKYRSENAKLHHDVEDGCISHTLKDQEISALNSEMESLRSQLMASHEETTAVRTSLDELMLSHQALENRCSAAEAEVQECTRREASIQDCEGQVDILHRQYLATEQKLDSCEGELQEALDDGVKLRMLMKGRDDAFANISSALEQAFHLISTQYSEIVPVESEESKHELSTQDLNDVPLGNLAIADKEYDQVVAKLFRIIQNIADQGCSNRNAKHKLEEEIAKLENDCKLLKDECCSIQNARDEANLKLQELEGKLSTFEEKCQQLESEMSARLSDFDDMAIRLSTRDGDNECLQNTIESLRNELTELRHTHQGLLQDRDHMVTENAALINQMSEHERNRIDEVSVAHLSELNQVQEKIQCLENELHDVKSRKAGLEEEVMGEQQANIDVTSALEQTRIAVGAADDQINKLSQQIDVLQAELKEKELAIVSMSAEHCEALGKATDALSEIECKFVAEQAKWTEEVANLEKSRCALVVAEQQHQREHTECLNTIKRLEEERSALNDKLNKQEHELTKQDQIITESHGKIKELMQSLQNMEAKELDRGKQEEVIVEMKDKLSQLSSHCMEIQQELSMTKSQIISCQAEKEDLIHVRGNLEKELVLVNNKLLTCETQIQKLEEDAKEKDALVTQRQEEAAMLQNQTQSHVLDHQTQADRILELENDVTALSREADDLRQAKVALESELEDLQMQMDEKESEMRRLQDDWSLQKTSYREEELRLQSELSSCQAQIDSLLSANGKLQQEVDGYQQLEEAAVALETQVNELRAQSAMLKEGAAKAEQDYNEVKELLSISRSQKDILSRSNEDLIGDNERLKSELKECQNQVVNLEHNSNLFDKLKLGQEKVIGDLYEKLEQLHGRYESQMELMVGVKGDIQKDVESLKEEISNSKKDSESDVKRFFGIQTQATAQTNSLGVPSYGELMKKCRDMELDYKQLSEKYDEALRDGSTQNVDGDVGTVDLNITDLQEENANLFKLKTELENELMAQQADKTEVQVQLEATRAECNNETQQLQQKLSDFQKLVETISTAKEKLSDELHCQRDEYEKNLSLARLDSLTTHTRSESEKQQIVQQITEVEKKNSGLRDRVRAEEEEKSLLKLKVSHLMRECELYERHIEDLEGQVQTQRAQLDEATQEHKETIKLLAELRFEATLSRQDFRGDFSRLEDEILRLGAQMGSQLGSQIGSMPSTPHTMSLVSVPIGGQASSVHSVPAYRKANRNNSTSCDEESPQKSQPGKEDDKAIHMKHAEMVDSMANLRLKMSEMEASNKKLHRENKLLQGRGEKEQGLTPAHRSLSLAAMNPHMGDRSVDVFSSRALSRQSSVSSVASVDSQIIPYDCSKELMAAHGKIAHLQKSKQQLKEERDLLISKLRKQENLVRQLHDALAERDRAKEAKKGSKLSYKLRRGLTGGSSGPSAGSLVSDSMVQQLELVQQHRDELLQNLDEHKDKDDTIEELMNQKTELEASLHRERALFREKCQEKEQLEVDVLREKLCVEKQMREFHHLQDLIRKKERIEQQLLSQQKQLEGELGQATLQLREREEVLRQKHSDVMSEIKRRVDTSEVGVQVGESSIPAKTRRRSAPTSQKRQVGTQVKERMLRLDCGCSADMGTMKMKPACRYHLAVEKIRQELKNEHTFKH